MPAGPWGVGHLQRQAMPVFAGHEQLLELLVHGLTSGLGGVVGAQDLAPVECWHLGLLQDVGQLQPALIAGGWNNCNYAWSTRGDGQGRSCIDACSARVAAVGAATAMVVARLVLAGPARGVRRAWKATHRAWRRVDCHGATKGDLLLLLQLRLIKKA